MRKQPKMMILSNIRATEHICEPTEEFRQTTYHHITIRKELQIHIAAHSFVHYEREVVLVCKRPKPHNIGTAEVRVPRKISVKTEDGWTIRCAGSEKSL
jgi:hypothetical protein